mmetsp:Transcript_64550/g.167817  ORF Transcript_64550/g.167817 Transcript_64550/m.167817 type:complete len:592 (-) Transcript_64550:119-1894(-)
MPNIGTHVKRGNEPIQVQKGEIPFTTLDIPHTWNKDAIAPKDYQASFQRFQPRQLDKSKDATHVITKLLEDKEAQLGDLRGWYNQVAESHGKVRVETRLLMSLSRKIDAVFAEDMRCAIETSDIETVEQLIKEVDEDPILAMIVKRSTSMENVQAMLPKVQQGNVAKSREGMDTGGGRDTRRASSAEILRTLKREKIKGWEHITFNPETGRLNLVTEILFAKKASVYTKDNPSAEFEDPEVAEAVLQEIARLYAIFQMPFEVVQVHKKAYASKGVDGGVHEEWLQDLAMTRATRIIDELQSIGVPKAAMTPKVEMTERSVVMQYCNFTMSYNHIYFHSQSGTISLKTKVLWEKRLYSRDQQDIPDAQFAEPAVASKVFSEVMKIAKFYKSDVDVVFHKTYSNCFDDEHKQWLDELNDNRSEKVKDDLVEIGLPDEKVEARVDVVDGEVEDGLAFHIEIVQDSGTAVGRKDTTASMAGPKGPDHVLEVNCCGNFDFNGTFKPCGMHNEQVKYRHTGGGKPTITYGADGFWYMCVNHDTRTGVYKCRELAGSEAWKHCTTNNSGLLPIVKKVVLHNGAPTLRSSRTGSVSFAQ